MLLESYTLALLKQQLFGKETGTFFFTQNLVFTAYPRWCGWSQFTSWGCSVRAAPPTCCYSSLWGSTFPSPHGRSVSSHTVWWAGSPRTVMWCAVLRSITLSRVGKPNPKYLKILLNLAGVLAIKDSFQCPQWIQESIIELNRKVSFPSYSSPIELMVGGLV